MTVASCELERPRAGMRPMSGKIHGTFVHGEHEVELTGEFLGGAAESHFKDVSVAERGVRVSLRQTRTSNESRQRRIRFMV